MNYSIVICTYNPDERILRRCLVAVRSLLSQNIDFEVFIVDNNSAVPVDSLSCVEQFLKESCNSKVLKVMQQGVGAARVAAIQHAVGNHIVMIDYDNEPAADYLQQLTMLHHQYPQVAAWGPGNVTVDFVDGIDADIESYAKIAFQEKHMEDVAFDGADEWQSCYPFGTGLCADAALLKDYVQQVQTGKYTMPGRKGNSLSGGEDTEMVLHCISRGFAVGSAPCLKLTHIIPANRANAAYMRKLAFYTSLDYAGCLLQVFPHKRDIIFEQLLPERKYVKKVVKQFLKDKFFSGDRYFFELSKFIGYQAGIYKVAGKPIPKMVQKFLHRLQIESA
jgi:glycosyltransferase involved in cell wall biosynthesis